MKSVLLGFAVALVLCLAGISIRGTVIIAIAFTVFGHWIIREINLVRNAHGTDIEDLENEIDELKKKARK